MKKPINLVVSPIPIRWPNPDSGPWTLTFYWVNEDGRAQLVGLDVHGFPGEWHDMSNPEAPSPQRITASLLRQIPIAGLSSETYRLAATAFGQAGELDDPTAQMLIGERSSSVRGRKPLGTNELRAVARIYSIGGRTPVRAVAKHFDISESAAAKRIANARKAGLIPPVTHKGHKDKEQS